MLLRKASLLLVFILLFLFSNSGNTELLPLFSDNELENLKLTPEEWALELNQYQKILKVKRDAHPYTTCDKNRFDKDNELGPIVSIIDPAQEGDVYRSTAPVRLLVYLKSRIAPINIDSLRVKGKRGFFSLNITDRMKPFMRQPLDGENADYVIDASIPKLGAGHYVLTLSLADMQGNEEEHKAFLEVFQKRQKF